MGNRISDEPRARRAPFYTADGRERAQIVVVAALLIAVVFVGVALTLNSAIFAENLASRDLDDGVGSAQDHHRSVHEDVARLIDGTNAGPSDTDFVDTRTRFEAAIEDRRRADARRAAERGEAIDYRLVSVSEGTRLRQTNESRDFTDMNGNWNWTLTEGIPDGGQFSMILQSKTLYESTLDTTMAALADSAFGIEFHLADYDGSGDGVWRVYFFQGAATDNVYAIVERPNETFEGNSVEAVSGYLDQSCHMKGRSLTVRLGQTTLGGVHCEDFEFYWNVVVHDVRFVNARTATIDGDQARARGTYDVLLANSTVNQAAFHDPGGGQPYQQSAIHSVTYRMTYRTHAVDYATADRTLGVDDDAVAGVYWNHPVVEQFAVTDVSGAVGDPAFELEWAVSDRAGDLDRVELYMVSRSSDEIVDEAILSVDGVSADGQTTLSDSSLIGDLGEEYRLQLVVVDDVGSAAAASEVRVAG